MTVQHAAHPRDGVDGYRIVGDPHRLTDLSADLDRDSVRLSSLVGAWETDHAGANFWQPTQQGEH